MKLSEAQRRFLNFTDRGKAFGLRPGANHFADIEYDTSERGVPIQVQGDDVKALLDAGIIEAVELSEPVETDAGLLCSHLYQITPAGRAALAEEE